MNFHFSRIWRKKPSEKGAQLSPYDREPYYQLAELYALQGTYWFRDQQTPLTQAECDQLVDVINQFLLRTTEGSHDGKLTHLLELYDQVHCPNALTDRRGIYPTLTPTQVKTEVSRQPGGPVETATELAFEQTLVAYQNNRSTRFAGLYPSKTPTASKTPRPTGTATRTRTPTRTPTQPPEPTQTEAATAVPQEQTSATPVPTKPVDEGLVLVGVLLVGGVMLSTAYLWQRFNKPRFPRSW